MPEKDMTVEEALRFLNDYLIQLYRSGHWKPNRGVEGALGPIRFRVGLTETPDIKDILEND